MRLFVLRGMTVRVHPLLPCLLAGYVLLGQGAFILAILTALLLHEGGHLLMASRLRLRVSQLEITPFGGAMQIDGVNQLSPARTFLSALSGPLINLITIPLSIIIIHRYRIIGGYYIFLLVASVLLLLVDLLPALPLDGGRMLLAILSRYIRRETAFRALLIIGRVGAVSAVLFSVYRALQGNYQPLPLMLGFYLLYTAALEEKQGASRYLAALISRRIRLDRRRALPVQTLCASRDMPLFTLLPQLNAGAYHRILVVDQDADKLLGIINEDALINAVLSDTARAVGDLLPQRAGQRVHSTV